MPMVIPPPYHHGKPRYGLMITPGDVVIWTLPGCSHWLVVGVVSAHSGAAAMAVGEDIATTAADVKIVARQGDNVSTAILRSRRPAAVEAGLSPCVIAYSRSVGRSDRPLSWVNSDAIGSAARRKRVIRPLMGGIGPLLDCRIRLVPRTTGDNDAGGT